MPDITITITADEDDLRAFVAGHSHPVYAEHRIAHAVCAALPKPRIRVELDAVVRRRGHGIGVVVMDANDDLWVFGAVYQRVPHDGLDPDEWEIAELRWPSEGDR